MTGRRDGMNSQVLLDSCRDYRGHIAQLVVYSPVKGEAVGSSPAVPVNPVNPVNPAITETHKKVSAFTDNQVNNQPQKQIVSLTETVVSRCRERVEAGEKRIKRGITGAMRRRHGL